VASEALSAAQPIIAGRASASIEIRAAPIRRCRTPKVKDAIVKNVTVRSIGFRVAARDFPGRCRRNLLHITENVDGIGARATGNSGFGIPRELLVSVGNLEQEVLRYEVTVNPSGRTSVYRVVAPMFRDWDECHLIA